MNLALSRSDLVPPMLRPAAVLLAEGRALARDCRVGRNLFLDRAGVATEAEYKRRTAAAGRIMQHAHIGFRSVERTCEAIWVSPSTIESSPAATANRWSAASRS